MFANLSSTILLEFKFKMSLRPIISMPKLKGSLFYLVDKPGARPRVVRFPFWFQLELIRLSRSIGSPAGEGFAASSSDDCPVFSLVVFAVP